MKINSQIEWSLWIKWAIATGIAFLANGVLLLIFSNLSAPVYYFEGFVIAFFQWLFVLRSRHLTVQNDGFQQLRYSALQQTGEYR